MHTYRRTAMAVTIIAAGLSVAACTAGITTAKQGTPPAPVTSHTAPSPTATVSRSASASASPSPGDTVSVGAPIGSFPIPHGAQVVANTTCGKAVIIELSSVTPAQTSSFYMSELPRSGYKVTGNTLVNGTGNGLPGAAAEINFTGHGIKGQIAAVANLGALASTGPSPVSVPSNIAKNLITIMLTPPGTSGCPG